MSILRRMAFGAIVALASLPPSHSWAHNPQDFGQFLRGSTMGDPVAAAPPPGLYFENTALLAQHIVGNGQVAGINVNALADMPLLVWSTGFNILGARLVLCVAQPVFNLTVWQSALSPNVPYQLGQFYPTIHNTFINPLDLSWNLGGGLFVSGGFGFYVPDGSTYNLTPNPDYWTFEPHVAASYLANDWDLTAHFLYDINTASTGHSSPFAGTPAAPFGLGYRSGNQAFLDITATKKWGKWELGPVAYFEWQTTADHTGSGLSCAQMQAATTVACGRAADYAVGGLLGYELGPVALKLIVTDTFYHADQFGGLALWTKLSLPLWTPEASAKKSLITKTK